MPDLPKELTQAIKKQYETLLKNKEGELILLPGRKKIWAAIGPKNDIGHVRRAKLSISCAERVLSIWNRVFCDEKGPEHILQSTQSYLQGEIDESELRAHIGSLWTALDNLMYEGDFLIEINAGYAAASAASTAISDDKYDEANIDDSTLDEDLDPYEWDAGYFASIAYAGGPPGADSSDSDKRREFWSWYLNNAVPNAWFSG
jgi:hypothetical protein